MKSWSMATGFLARPAEAPRQLESVRFDFT
jgi:hypothetical protein